MIDGMTVLDAVVHAFNYSPDNYRNKHGHFIADMSARVATAGRPVAYRLPEKAFRRDWSIEEIAKITFLESDTDLAVYHVLPLNAFKDGLCNLEKAIEARKRWPNRFLFYIGIDPMAAGAFDEMERQYEALEGDVVGLKLYPNSWLGDKTRGWLMNDPAIAFPAFAKARDMGLRTVAIHKALPLGPVEMLHYRVDDIDRAAAEFPELNFEIVHGGLAFVEETTWQLARFPNVYVNLESTSVLAMVRPLEFERVMLSFMRSPDTTRRILWGTGGPLVMHQRPLLESFRNFQFNDDLVGKGNIPQITKANKQDILCGNFSRMAGIDLEKRLSVIAGDEFSQQRREMDAACPPYSTSRIHEYS